MRISDWAPPGGLLARIRWAYLVSVVFFTVTFMPQITVQSARPIALRVVAVVALCLLTIWWARGYRRGSFPAAALPLEAVAIFATALAPVEPSRAMGLLFIGISFRTLYGGWAHTLWFTGLSMTALYAAHLVAREPGGPVDLGPLFQAPALAVVTHFMVVAMERGERATSRERVISAASLALARATTLAELEATAVSSARALLPDPRGVTVRLDLAAVTPDVIGGLVLPVTGRRATLGHLVVESGGQVVPTESRAALEALTHSLGLSLTTLGLFADLRVRADRDDLTGLDNRASLHARLAELVLAAALEETGGLHVLLIDLDQFKAVNDTSGHAAGDVVLKATAGRLREAVRADDLIARLGGDEFAVVLARAVTNSDAEGAAQRVRTAMAQPVLLPSGTAVTVGVSVGLATWCPPMTADDLLHAADMAMYAEKRSGRRVVAGMSG